MIFVFGDFELDEERRELRRGGAVVPLAPKPFALLRHLLRHRDRVVPKRELLEVVWPDVAVTESSLAGAIRNVRRALEEAGAEQRFVRTLWRRGTRFVAPVEERVAGTPQGTSEAAGGRVRLAGPGGALAKLERALADASAGRGRIVLLSGGSGSGRTRTAEQLAERATRGSARVLASWGPAARPGVVWGTWLPILRSLVDLADEAALNGRLRSASVALAGLLPELRARVRGLAEPTAGSRVIPGFPLFDAVASLLRDASQDRTLVLILDDLQSADRSSLRLLQFVAREIAGHRVLLLIASREGDGPIRETLAELARCTGFERIRLTSLEAAVGSRPDPPGPGPSHPSSEKQRTS
jgi:DNA-binding winged helix-turn-helix (wHTH) protein